MMQQVELKITIENCNSIDLADIILLNGSLNIKYGPNGIGKSTIAKAMMGQIMQLNPHKFESVPEYVIDECTQILTA